jgi:uncharacterized protein with FMN-binding domain
MEDTSKSKKIGFSIIGVAVLGLVGYGAWAMNKKAIDAPSIVPPTDNTNVPVTGGTQGAFKDGLYSKTVTYIVPSGTDDFRVNLTLANGIITDISTDVLAKNEDSIKYQTKFSSKIKAVVVGKNINDVKVGVISGASLTSQAFNDAIGQIKVSAQS